MTAAEVGDGHEKFISVATFSQCQQWIKSLQHLSPDQISPESLNTLRSIRNKIIGSPESKKLFVQNHLIER